MSSQKEPTPVPAPPTDVVKTEEAANTSDGATMKPDTSDASGLETAPPTDVLTKKDYEEMSKVVKYMTEYKNEEYVVPKAYRRLACEVLTTFFVFKW